jgi:cyclophilin family peptidyl-prolyl cis-trans isomerase
MLPQRIPFQSDEEEGESSDNSSGGGRYNSNNSQEGGNNGYGCEHDEHDSYSSSSPSLEEGTRGSYTNENASKNANTITNSITNTSVVRKELQPGSANGNKSDSQLESLSAHKRALHEAGLPISVLRGNNSNETHNNNFLRNGHPRLRSDSENTPPRNNLETSLPPEYMVTGDTTKGRTSAAEVSINTEAGLGGAKTTTITIHTSSRITEKILTSKVWRILRTNNPIFLLLVTGVSMLGVGLYTQSYATLSITLEQVITNTNERRRAVTGHFDSIEKDMYNLERQLHELDPDASFLLSSINDDESINGSEDETAKTDNKNIDGETIEHHKNARSSIPQPPVSELFDEIVAVKEKMRIESSRISAFEKYIQTTSLRDATRKYGTGVLRVQLNLEFLSERDSTLSDNMSDHGKTEVLQNAKSGHGSASSSSSSSSAHSLILEMAPLELMPHSIYTFLEMVDAKLFDGCSFILNAMNVIKAAPLPYEKGVSPSKMAKAFTRLGLDTVSFREYSDDYPHEQYTVGFAADGSPSFYINTDDNTEQHAGEPCFARIVSGFETVDKMEAEPVRSGMWYKKRIGIKKVTIL